ncbi:MAG: hypothetical protein ABSA69_07680 [Verrucomicrobiota bacterium]|jgi:hypothetical protein
MQEINGELSGCAQMDGRQSRLDNIPICNVSMERTLKVNATYSFALLSQIAPVADVREDPALGAPGDSRKLSARSKSGS